MKKYFLLFILLLTIPLISAFDLSACDFDYINITSNKTINSVSFDNPNINGLNISVHRINSLNYYIKVLTSCDIPLQEFDFVYYISLDDEIIKKTYSSGVRYVYISNNTENNTGVEGEEEFTCNIENKEETSCDIIPTQEEKNNNLKYLILIPIIIILLCLVFIFYKIFISKFKTGGKK